MMHLHVKGTPTRSRTKSKLTTEKQIPKGQSVIEKRLYYMVGQKRKEEEAASTTFYLISSVVHVIRVRDCAISVWIKELFGRVRTLSPNGKRCASVQGPELITSHWSDEKFYC